jgi:hypothetical protein
MPYAAPTPPRNPDGSPPPAVDARFYGGQPSFAMPPPGPAGSYRQPHLDSTWVMAGRVLITVLHGFVVLFLGIAGLGLIMFNDDPPPDQNIGMFLLTILLIVGITAVVLTVLTGGMWYAKRWAYWGMLVLYSGVLGFVAVAWALLLTNAAVLWTTGLLAPIWISLAIPLAVLSYLVMTWPKKYLY